MNTAPAPEAVVAIAAVAEGSVTEGAVPEPAVAATRARGARRHWRLRSYLAGLVVFFVAAVTGGILYQRGQAVNDARRAAAQDASIAAGLGAKEIASEISLMRSTVASTAANPGIARTFAAPGACSLSFAGPGVFTAGHLDVVGADGSVVCSSLPPPRPPGYGGAPWLPEATIGAMTSGPVVDARTGKLAIMVSAPIPGRGAVVAFLNLEPLGPGLASSYAGPRQLEFLVTTADGSTALSRSANPQRWAGAALGATPFARLGGVSRPDVDGRARIYGSAEVAGPGWKVFAGADRAAALAAANGLNRRELSIAMAGLLLFLVAALIVSRRITGPIEELSNAVRAAINRRPGHPIPHSGPAEVADLADDFERLLASAERELVAVSRLAAIVESSADAIIGVSPDGVITSWNTAAESLYGYPVGEAIGQRLTDLAPVERQSEVVALLERAGRGEQVMDHETKGGRQDGTTFDISISVSPVRDGAGLIVGMAWVGRDITAQNRAVAERRTLEQRLNQSQRLESLGQLASGIAHDFNNLLGVIMSYSGLVAKQTAGNDSVQADVAEIKGAAERGGRLTRQLLIFGHREAVAAEDLDLNGVVSEMQSMLSRTIGGQIGLVVEEQTGLPAVRADRGQMEQVVLNLALNARDAMPAGGALSIATRTAELDDEYVRLHPGVAPGPYVELSVSDTGVGMAPAVATHVFEPFFTTKAKGEGTGLGLATLYGIVTEAGGHVTVYSKEGIGTTFRVFLPVVATTASGAMMAPGGALGGEGETVLVVEDDAPLLEATARMLRRNGYGVLEASTWQQAVSLAAGNDIQLLLTDSVVPPFPGRDLAERISQLRPGAGVLFMSGHTEEVLSRQRVLDRDSALIEKPFSERDLLQKVRAGIRARSGPPLP